MIKTRSVWSDPIRKSDGLRILVARVRGHGLPRDRYAVWMPNLGPSERLLRDVRSGRITWAEFNRAYAQELFASGGVDASNRVIKNHGQKFTLRLIKALAKHGNVTLMCHCDDDQKFCHRHTLKRLLESGRV